MIYKAPKSQKESGLMQHHILKDWQHPAHRDTVIVKRRKGRLVLNIFFQRDLLLARPRQLNHPHRARRHWRY